MDSSVKFALENIEQTKKIYDVIKNLRHEIWTAFDDALRESFNDWFGNDWQLGESSLSDDGYIWAAKKNFFQTLESGGKTAPVYIELDLRGNDPLWSFFGQSNDKENGSIIIYLDTSGLKEIGLEDFKERSSMLDDIIRPELEPKGYIHRIEGNCHWYKRDDVFFSNVPFLKLIEEGDAEEALRPLREAWQVLVDLDWDRIAEIACPRE